MLTHWVYLLVYVIGCDFIFNLLGRHGKINYHVCHYCLTPLSNSSRHVFLHPVVQYFVQFAVIQQTYWHTTFFVISIFVQNIVQYVNFVIFWVNSGDRQFFFHDSKPIAFSEAIIFRK